MAITKKNLVPKKTAKSILADKAKKSKKTTTKKKIVRLPRASVPETSGKGAGTAKAKGLKLADVPELLQKAVRLLVEKKGENIILMEVSELVGYTDYFLLATGNSTPQVQAMAEAVAFEVKHAGKPTRIEGKQDAVWVLIDGGDFVVHLFQPEARKFYSLEDLWGDACLIEIDEQEILAPKRKTKKAKTAATED
ncbi:MAG TPA: ribosome silencing factor [Candidatus Ozemobacteraceae bacterium]|nr:ribosome silencing factor [Candidatus Ozemobacteraceae bacterium]